MRDKSSAKRVVSQDGLTIYYWVNWNRGLSKNFQVLHPGSSMNHSSLQSLEQGLNERGFPSLVLDPRGVGFSDAPSEPEYFTLGGYSADLRRIIEQEGLENPSYVGHSFGFMPIADYVAQTSNARDITGICASHKFSETAQNKLLFHLFNRILRYGEYAGSAGTKLAHWIRGEKRLYPDQSQLDGKSDFDVWLSIVDVSFRDVKSHTVSGIEINKWDITEQLKQIGNPTLLIYGTNDQMVKARAGEHISSLLRGKCNVEVIEGTHSLPVTQANDVLVVMEKYLLKKP